jgi:hypothetical protein
MLSHPWNIHFKTKKIHRLSHIQIFNYSSCGTGINAICNRFPWGAYWILYSAPKLWGYIFISIETIIIISVKFWSLTAIICLIWNGLFYLWYSCINRFWLHSSICSQFTYNILSDSKSLLERVRENTVGCIIWTSTRIFCNTTYMISSFILQICRFPIPSLLIWYAL